MPDNTNMREVRESTSDIRVTGDPGAWVVVCKASSSAQGWSKATKAMDVPGGVLVQCESEFRSDGVVTATSQSTAFVPGAKLDVVRDDDGMALTAKIKA